MSWQSNITPMKYNLNYNEDRILTNPFLLKNKIFYYTYYSDKLLFFCKYLVIINKLILPATHSLKMGWCSKRQKKN